MARLERTSENTPETEARWSTWEELLLACAVNHHGTKNWDSVAVELQKRSSVPAMMLSPENCKLKYIHLKRRFTSGEVNGVGYEHNERTETAVPLLEELRKLRVAELKRDVERYDLSILSLQLKVKTLTEERDRSQRDGERSDLAIIGEGDDCCEHKIEGDAKITPESNAVDLVTGEKDQQSMNESISTDQKGGSNARAVTSDDQKPSGAGRTGNVEDEPRKERERKAVRADSCNGSSNSVEKEPVRELVKTESVTDWAELLESVAESKVNEEGTKENSDVQSSVSKSRKAESSNRENWRSRSCNERGNTNESPATKIMPSEFQPLINFLEKIESHKHGSLFTRMLESQQTEDYKLLIRQHIDFETVRLRLHEGRYVVCKAKFFRDLLVLANNAIIIFRKNTSELTAAMELRQLISKELSRAKVYFPSLKQKSLIKLGPFTKEENPKQSDKQDAKSLVGCRKSNSITAPKSSGSSSGVDNTKDQIARKFDDGPSIIDVKPKSPSQAVLTNPEENRTTMKRMRETRNEKNFNCINQNKISATVVEKAQRKRENHPSKSENNNNSTNNAQSNTDSKKRGAANFLNRMKQSSSTNSRSLMDAVKSTPLSDDNKSRKELPLSSKPPLEQVIQKGTFRKVSGRPPKRAAAPSSQLNKRNLEVDLSEPLATKQAKKRPRR
ncbi:unnamed protein product [Cuscuta campestris]|uniref:Uncharacterized protein n=1 Tax=Cuscuta campestris TaxID=132261 RepID=A0A484LCE6_9ASTE|nr:unnamed protein product [Cuscuta campestris]